MKLYFDTVVNSNTGRAIEGATVSFLDDSGTAVTTYADDAFGGAALSTTTDENGLYQRYVPDGTYTIRHVFGSISIDVDGVEIYDDSEQEDAIDRALLVPEGETGVILPEIASRAGQFLAFDAEGRPIAVGGTGADEGLRTDMAASSGATLSGFIQPGSSAAAQTAAAKLSENPSFNGAGAVGDGATNDATALQAALSDTALLLISGGAGQTYRHDSALTFNRSNTRIDKLKLKPVSSSNITALTLGPTAADATTTLSANAAMYATSVQVTSATSAAIGKLIVFTFTNTTWTAQDALAASYMFVSKIVGVSGTTIEIQDNLPQAITTGMTHSVGFWTPATDIEVQAALDLSGMGSKKTIAAITKANPAVLTVTGHGFTTGQTVTINGPNTSGTTTGMFEIHGARAVITVIDANSFSLTGVNSTGYSTYSGGATVRLEAHGVNIACVDRAKINLYTADNDGAGYGVNIGIAYDSDIAINTRNCGNQVSAAAQSTCATNCTISTRSSGGSGFGVLLSGLHYCNVTDRGASRSDTGRGFKTARSRFSTFYGSSSVNSEFTSLALAWVTQDCVFIGWRVIGSTRTSAQNGGFWSSACYNTGNKLIGCTMLGNTSFDTQVNSTDSVEFVGCDLGAFYVETGGTATVIGGSYSSVSNSGTLSRIMPGRIDISGNGSAVLTDSVSGYPLKLVGAGGSALGAFIGTDSSGHFTAYTDREVLRLERGAPASGNSNLMLCYHNGTSVTFQRVSLGASDSGGTGYKALRVPN